MTNEASLRTLFERIEDNLRELSLALEQYKDTNKKLNDQINE